MANVTIYSTPWCTYCKMAKEYFASKNVAFTEKDVEQDVAAREEMVAKTGQLGVPVITIDDKIIVGFDKSHINEILQIK